MEIKLSSSSITWERVKMKHGKKIRYENQILKHKDHISISKIMFVNGEIKHSDLTHIPLELIDKIKLLSDVVD